MLSAFLSHFLLQRSMANLAPSLKTYPHLLHYKVVKSANLPNATCSYFRLQGTHTGTKVRTLGRHGECSKFQRNRDTKVSASSQTPVLQMPPRTEIEELEKVSCYLFRTDVGGQVKVYVGRKDEKHLIVIEAYSLPETSDDTNLVLAWGVLRSASAPLMPLKSQSSAALSKSNTAKTPFVQKSRDMFALQLEFERNQDPFYLSFVLQSMPNAASSNIEVRSDRGTYFRVPVGIASGYPDPLGISFDSDGSVNFALFSRNARSVSLCLYDDMEDKPSLEIDLDPYINRSGDIWHVKLESIVPYVSYGYRCNGAIAKEKGVISDGNPVLLLDPYAKILHNTFFDDTKCVSYTKARGSILKEPIFDWSGEIRPCLSMESLMVYRLNVEHFTSDKSSRLPAEISGTFSGLVEKLDHFRVIGINAVLLEPVFPYDVQKGPYYPYHFFSPMSSYGRTRDSISAINSMKEMVKTFHANNIEVLMEVVFSHTAESGNSASEIVGMRGIDELSYYVSDENVKSGDGNALNCNNTIVQKLVLDSLRHWVTEFHIDGFCFINSSSLLRGSNGEYLSRPLLVEAISFDPLLSKTKIISDCWNPYDMMPKDVQFPHWKRWAEMNTKFCYDVRNFLRGEGLLSELATRLCGSGDIFSGGRGPAFSFNFIARNFGLPLIDLVSFISSDLSSELSWNCGEEGPTNTGVVQEIRLKQIRNFLFILYVSLGVPVLNMGDECCQSCNGSPLYSDRNFFDWDFLETTFGAQMTQFISFLSSLRVRRGDLLQKRNFVLEKNVDWHGSNHIQPRWEDPTSKFLAMTLKADPESIDNRGDLFLSFNADHLSESVVLPPASERMTWFRLVDTALPFPEFFSADGEPVVEQVAGVVDYEIKPHSCALFEARSPVDLKK